MDWPTRNAICLDCRTALPAERTCPGGHGHRVTRLDTAAGREELLVAAWGPKPIRQRLLAATKVGAAGASGGTFAQACSGCDPFAGDDIRILIVLVVLFAVIAGVWFLAGWIRERVRVRRLGRMARGATHAGPECGRRTNQTGVIASKLVAVDPLTRRSCVAFATVLRHHGKVMLRDAVTVGFEVELDSGGRVRIPEGLCVIEVPLDATVEPQPRDLAAYRRSLNPLRDTPMYPRPELEVVRKAKLLVDADLNPFVANRVELVTLMPGQRVEIASELEPAAPTGETGYREAHHVLVPRGPVRLRPC